MMLFRRPAQLAVQAILLLALEPDVTCHRVREIAAKIGVPATYLTKVFQELTRAGLLRGVRGPGGGMQLARSAHEIHLWDVLSAFERTADFERCLLGLQRCNNLNPCPLDKAWAPLRAQILAMMQTENLWGFASEARRRRVLGWEATHDERARLGEWV